MKRLIPALCVAGVLALVSNTILAQIQKDQPAIMLIMGQQDKSISDHYRERIDDKRLNAITDHVRKWLMKGKPKGKGKSV